MPVRSLPSLSCFAAALLDATLALGRRVNLRSLGISFGTPHDQPCCDAVIYILIPILYWPGIRTVLYAWAYC